MRVTRTHKGRERKSLRQILSLSRKKEITEKKGRVSPSHSRKMMTLLFPEMGFHFWALVGFLAFFGIIALRKKVVGAVFLLCFRLSAFSLSSSSSSIFLQRPELDS